MPDCLQHSASIVGLHACRWLQPTLEIVGMQGGHTDNGTRGVVISKAFAKIMCRLVPDQNASVVLESMQQHVASHAPPHTNFTLTAVASHGRLLTEPYFIPKDAPGNIAAAKVMSALWSCLVAKVWHPANACEHLCPEVWSQSVQLNLAHIE